jgi:hypothetical protein
MGWAGHRPGWAPLARPARPGEDQPSAESSDGQPGELAGSRLLGPPVRIAFFSDRAKEFNAATNVGTGAAFYIQVPDVDAFHETLQARGCEVPLRPYEAILEGTIQGYFMGMQRMERAEAEVAAKEHLAKMPAWSLRE